MKLLVMFNDVFLNRFFPVNILVDTCVAKVCAPGRGGYVTEHSLLLLPPGQLSGMEAMWYLIKGISLCK